VAEQASIQTMRRLWYLIAETRQQMSNALKKDFARYNMSPRQSYILRTIQELGEDATLKNLSERTYREPNSVSVQVSALEKKGFIKKSRDKYGTNLIRIEVTQKGSDFIEYANKFTTMRKILSVISEEEAQQLMPYLLKLERHAKKIGTRIK
jgi:DNA-binding MarR family transcriptional regulator